MPKDAGTAAEPALAGAAEFFDPVWYRKAYPETSDVEPFRHFLLFGDGERRSPGPTFDAEFYAGTYLALEERSALAHYLQQGRAAGYLPLPAPRNAAQSHAAMAATLAGLTHPFVLLGNDAQRAGAPLLLLELSRHLRRRGWSPVFVLDRGGPLLDQFRAVGPTLLVAEGHDLGGIGAALDRQIPVLANTSAAAVSLAALNHAGPAAVLVHEMPQYLLDHGLVQALEAAPVVVCGLSAVTDGVAALLSTESVVRTIQLGLLHSNTGPAATARIGQVITSALGPDRLLFLGAGFADHRKGFDRFLAFARQLQALEPRSGFIWLGELGAWAQALVDELPPDFPAMFPGFRLDASAWYDHVDLYLLTSRQDPGPTTVADAARRGVPFVAAPGDLGLRSLTVLDGTFVDDEQQVAGVALHVALTQLPQQRADRAAKVEAAGRFGRYVDDLLDLLGTQGLASAEPGRFARGE